MLSLFLPSDKSPVLLHMDNRNDLNTRVGWYVLIVVTAVFGSAWIFFSREPAGATSSTLTEAPFVGHLAPDFTLNSLDGETITISDYAGKPVVLNYWATWCPPCRIEMPHLQQASEEYGGRVVFLGINQAESEQLIRDFRDEYALTYPLLLDPNLTAHNLYSVLNLPTTIFIDAQGVVREVVVGTVNAAVLQDRLLQLLDE
jgi:peroxiredoxin